MYILPLSRIHNTSLVSAYYGLDKCECVYNIYYIINLLLCINFMKWTYFGCQSVALRLRASRCIGTMF
jgi:hypothetical protein